jgi:ADP-ribosylglycohydrolase
MTDSHDERLKRARLSLEGLSVGDALGGFFEMQSVHPVRVLNRTVPDALWHWTDDTSMALSIFSILRQFQGIDQDKLAVNFADHYERERGYGMGARHLLTRVRKGEYWREVAGNIFSGGSYGNGGAMRIAPLGAYFADDLPALIENARLSAEITHAHPEGIAGGIAVAVAAAFAWNLREKRKPSRPEFIDLILPHVPDSDVKTNCLKARDLPAESDLEAVIDAIGNGQRVTAPDTVPFVLYNAGEYLDHYEEAIWQTLAGGGDADTTAAMVGGIVALSTGEASIPANWLEHREALPEWAFAETL